MVLYTLLYLLSKVGLKVAIKPKLSTYGTLLRAGGNCIIAFSYHGHCEHVFLKRDGKYSDSLKKFKCVLIRVLEV